MVIKSTMVEFVSELLKLKKECKDLPLVSGLDHMIAEAKAGEYHDYKNNKYTCGKVQASSDLRAMGFIDLAKRIENGEFDEEADAEDRARLKREALDGGFTESQCKALFNL